jgi:Domain of unknown function (DUF4291)
VTDHSSRLVRAAYTRGTITVYQAYGPQIADAAARAGTFVSPFSQERMTWIKPSFGWMMHRSGWASKPGQECVLAIEIGRAGFEWALAHSCLSRYSPAAHASPEAWAALKDSSPVRIQWDPDRVLSGEQLPRRAIQVGLSDDAVRCYAGEWIRSISDITAVAIAIGQLAPAARADEAARRLPAERVYPLDPVLAARIGADQYQPATASETDRDR